MINNSLAQLVSNGSFRVEQFIYDEEAFGNVFILLKSNDIFEVRFIKDRGDYWCQVGQLGKWYFFEDVATILSMEIMTTNTDYLNFITETLTIIKNNLNLINKAFGTEHSTTTHNKLKNLAKNKAKEMFGQL